MRGTLSLLMRLMIGCACAALFSAGAAWTSAQQLTPTWVQLGEGDTAVAKVVVASAGNCPSINIGGKKLPMVERHPIPDGFRPLCEAAVPSNTRSASVNGQALALPKSDPSIVTVFGDTGCRIKSSEVQNCKNPAKWPFEQVAADAAAEKPDLMIHVGDYLYREIPCPSGSEAMCGSTPSGDNWETWNADFFTPAAKLLAVVPWAFTRGNHESCDRSWRGWFYYFDSRAWDGVCERYSAPYFIKLGSFELVILDSSEVQEDGADENQVSTYTTQLASIHTTNAWLVAHHPFWAFKSGIMGKPSVSISVPLQEAWNRASPKGIDLILSGHIHLFELVVLDHARPPQIVAGGGGTNLAAPITASLNGKPVLGSTVVESQSEDQFGYTVLAKRGDAWHLSLKNQLQDVVFSCSLEQSGETSAADRTGEGYEGSCGGF
jgi:hypothetical protein